MKILVIQTAFIGDVVLATGIVEKLHQYYPEAQIDFLVRKGNEALLDGHPFLHKVLIWNKKEDKYKNLYKLIKEIRAEKYDRVISLQRFMAASIMTITSKAKHKAGFNKSPLSFLFTEAYPHDIGNKGDKNYKHEVMRNHQLISKITDDDYAKPKLYPRASHFDKVKEYKAMPYITIAPASVWYTKQFHESKWVELLKQLPSSYPIYLLGGPGDKELSDKIIGESERSNAFNLAGKLSYLDTAALMKDAVINYCNDSAPMHFASAMNAPVSAIYCSTIPEFGFGPLSDQSFVVEVQESLYCRPCGLHGHKACPEKHFKCALDINISQLTKVLKQ